MLGTYFPPTPRGHEVPTAPGYHPLGEDEITPYEIAEDRKRALKIFLSISIPGYLLWYMYFSKRR